MTDNVPISDLFRITDKAIECVTNDSNERPENLCNQMAVFEIESVRSGFEHSFHMCLDCAQEYLAWIVEQHKGAIRRCPYCGDDRTGKASFIKGKQTFCNEEHYNLWWTPINDAIS